MLIEEKCTELQMRQLEFAIMFCEEMEKLRRAVA